MALPPTPPLRAIRGVPALWIRCWLAVDAERPTQFRRSSRSSRPSIVHVACQAPEAAQHDCPRHTNALVGKIELSDGVLAQGDERNAAEVGQRCVLEDDLGQFLGAISSDLVVPDTAQDKSRTSNVRGC